MQIYIAADHAGFELKSVLIDFLKKAGHEVEDCGAYDFDKDDDYPEIIARAAKKLSHDSKEGIESRAIVIGASGQGEAMVANRFRGVRCALYYGFAGLQKDITGKELDIISGSREHNNANALSLGARFISIEEAKQAIKKWLATPFSGEERHTRRIAKIDEIS